MKQQEDKNTRNSYQQKSSLKSFFKQIKYFKNILNASTHRQSNAIELQHAVMDIFSIAPLTATYLWGVCLT